VCGADRVGPARDRARSRARTRLRGKRVRVRPGAVPVDAARRDRPARAVDGGAPAARRGSDRPLPELRAHGAAPLRRGRHVLRARAAVRARMKKPVIGITTYVVPASWGHWQLETALIPYDYVRAVERAGGRALLVPPDDDSVEETLDRLDGIVFSGGEDIGENEARDRGEFALLQAALARDVPVLAVCRGFEVLNVARGGDLIQHLPDVVGHEQHRAVMGEF